MMRKVCVSMPLSMINQDIAYGAEFYRHAPHCMRFSRVPSNLPRPITQKGENLVVFVTNIRQVVFTLCEGINNRMLLRYAFSKP
jgi:hypothetical protein